MATKQISLQLTDAQVAQIKALTAMGFGSATDVVRIAVDRMFGSEVGSKPVVAMLQIWQHRTSGERYAVLNGNGIQGGYGPMDHEDAADIMASGFGDRLWDAELADAIDDHSDDYRVVWPYISG